MISPHRPESPAPRDLFRHYLGDLVYGANDGIVTTFTIVSGVAGAALSPAVILILGFVNLLADGFSMGASNFLAIRSNDQASGTNRGIREPMLHGLATLLSFALVGSVPLLAYLVPGARDHALLISCFSSAAALFGVGASRSLVARGGWLRSGLEMLGIGLLAAGVAYGAGAWIARWLR